MVPGIMNDTFDPPLQKQDTSPLLHIPAATPEAKIPFLSTFLHAVPTRAPGDPHRMHSIVQGFFMGPITGEEKKRRITNRIKSPFSFRFPALLHLNSSHSRRT
jgi:RNA exonuclease 1